jgi:putative addiction module killer protein
MKAIRLTVEFRDWLRGLRDGVAKARIASRLERLADGNPGDVKPIGGGLSELRIPHGPGYRVYFVTRGSVVVVVLCGGDKGSQQRDIRRAHEIAKELED